MITDFATESERVAARLRVALELHRAGVAMMRSKLRRDYPQASDEELDAHLARWLSAADEPLPAPLRRRSY